MSNKPHETEWSPCGIYVILSPAVQNALSLLTYTNWALSQWNNGEETCLNGVNIKNLAVVQSKYLEAIIESSTPEKN